MKTSAKKVPIRQRIERAVSNPYTLFKSQFSKNSFFDVNMDPNSDDFDPLYVNPNVPISCGICPLGLMALLGKEKLFQDSILKIPADKFQVLNGSDLANQIFYWACMGGNENIILTWCTLIVDVKLDFNWGLLDQDQPRTPFEILSKGNPELLLWIAERSNVKSQMEFYTQTDDSNRDRAQLFSFLLEENDIPVTADFKIPKSRIKEAMEIGRKYIQKHPNSKNISK